MMPNMKYVILHQDDRLEFVEIPADHAYQLGALLKRLHKEIGKLTASHVPQLPTVAAEAERVEIEHPRYPVVSSLDYINELESQFAAIEETNYPLISLLTEIRALQAQLEQWYEEEQYE